MKKQLLLLSFFCAFSIAIKAQMAIDATVTAHACYNDCNGSVTYTFDPGETFEYMIQLDGLGGENSSFSNGTITGLCVGEYTLSVIDILTMDYASVTFTIGAEMPLWTDVMVLNNYCPSNCISQIGVLASGGMGTYQYSWTPSVSSTDFAEGLCPGDYTITVTDEIGCSVTQYTTVTIQQDLFSTINYTNTSCQGLCDGVIVPDVYGGVMPYDYLWEDETQIISGGEDLCAGNYFFTITDANGCFVKDTIEILDGPACRMMAGAGTGLAAGSTMQADEWMVYPNPAKDVVYIKTDKSLEKKQYKAEVFNAIGEIVLENVITENTTGIHLNSLENGMYFLKIYAFDETTVKQIILAK